MRMVIVCVDVGLMFVGVYDFFWTYATDVDIMNVILCEKFIEVYKEFFFENFYYEFCVNYLDVVDEFF